MHPSTQQQILRMMRTYDLWEEERFVTAWEGRRKVGLWGDGGGGWNEGGETKAEEFIARWVKKFGWEKFWKFWILFFGLAHIEEKNGGRHGATSMTTHSFFFYSCDYCYSLQIGSAPWHFEHCIQTIFFVEIPTELPHCWNENMRILTLSLSLSLSNSLAVQHIGTVTTPSYLVALAVVHNILYYSFSLTTHEHFILWNFGLKNLVWGLLTGVGMSTSIIFVQRVHVNHCYP